MLIIDAHLDLSMNAMEWNRDLRLPVRDIRDREKGMSDKPGRTHGTVAFPELRAARIGLVVATQIARFVAPDNPLPGWHSPEQAWAHTQAQLAWYRAMEAEGELVQIRDRRGLDDHLALWSNEGFTGKKPIGYILSLEGADSLVDISYLDSAWEYGLRALGPAHYGPGRYANGTDASGQMDEKGLALLRRMEQLNMILDMTHLCDDAFWQALDHFGGPIWASHHNCRHLVNHNRQLSDEMVTALVRRDAVIGVAMDAWMLVPGWKRGISDPHSMGCGLAQVVEHIDHICQLAGDDRHVGIGSDLDGGFGKEQSPFDLDTIADLVLIHELLENRGYDNVSIERLLHGNWIRILQSAWKEA